MTDPADLADGLIVWWDVKGRAIVWSFVIGFGSCAVLNWLGK